MDFLSISQIIDFALVFVILMFSIVIHEVSHGWTAEKFGDPTARLMGRLTLNPLKHIDPFGTIILPILLKFLGLPPLGWAKPVPVNPYNMKNPRRDMIWVGAAGPFSNLVLASCGIVAMILFFRFRTVLPIGLIKSGIDVCQFIILVNIMLATFNLIPIPPLDGSRILAGLIPTRWAHVYSQIEPYGFLIVLGLLYFNLLNSIFRWVEEFTVFIIKYFIG